MTIPAGYAQLNFIFGGDQLPRGAQVTLGVDPNPLLSAQDCADVAKVAWEDNMLAQQHTACTLLEVLAKLGPDATGPSATSVSGQAGAVSASGMTPQVAILVSKNTALGGRRGKGRMYVPGVWESFVGAAGDISPSDVAGYQAAVEAFAADLIAGDMQPVLLHGNASTPTTITGYTVQAKVATQRRRLRG